MFHQGDLQSGIALAIQQSKSVACFVRGTRSTPSCVDESTHSNRTLDDDRESSEWENEWLQEEQVRGANNSCPYTEIVLLIDHKVAQVLTTKAVVLRLQAGSQEAGFLAAFCPVNEVPILVIIQYARQRYTTGVG